VYLLASSDCSRREWRTIWLQPAYPIYQYGIATNNNSKWHYTVSCSPRRGGVLHFSSLQERQKRPGTVRFLCNPTTLHVLQHSAHFCLFCQGQSLRGLTNWWYTRTVSPQPSLSVAKMSSYSVMSSYSSWNVPSLRFDQVGSISSRNFELDTRAWRWCKSGGVTSVTVSQCAIRNPLTHFWPLSVVFKTLTGTTRRSLTKVLAM
jgi:hypothetical protein